jgi:hypothetical protein
MPPQADLRLSSKAGIVIELNRFELGFDVFAGFGMLVFSKECQRFRVAVRGLIPLIAIPGYFHNGFRKM